MKRESLIESVVSAAEGFLIEKKEYVKGQFFTPLSIAQFMAKLCDISKISSSVKILDPGAGLGILTICLCLELIKSKKIKTIHVDLYEIDTKLTHILNKNMTNLDREIKRRGIEFTFTVIDKDFISRNAAAWNDKTIKPEYDIAIANPPYFKLNKDDQVCFLMSDIVHGQPNIYSLFMALSSRLIKDKGQLIFITPRSYCSGLYFKAFRKWFFEVMKPKRIHVFESRKKAVNSEVLQETIIMKADKIKEKKITVDISTSYDANLTNKYRVLKDVPFQLLMLDNDHELFLKIPTTEEDLKLLKKVHLWSNTLLTLGFKLSTGPVVDFRSRDFLIDKKEYDGKKTAPLFWMHNINGFTAKWPAPNGYKAASIKISNDSQSVLVKNKNYVFVKRFTAKEQKRRIYAAVYRNSHFKTEYIGIENHLNYIWKTSKGDMRLSEAYGLMALLNSSFVDRYFRNVSGSTQVNATEINNMPLPDLKIITSIGDVVKKGIPNKFEDIDNLINNIVSI